MAPALVETATTTGNSGPVPASVYKVDLGQYKEIDLTYIDKDAEEGKAGGPPAKVSRFIQSMSSYSFYRRSHALTNYPVPSLPAHMEPSPAVSSSRAL